ncbi:hypothetical protein BKA80DRAFT_261403 [Phyllosticta citrichinensis]
MSKNRQTEAPPVPNPKAPTQLKPTQSTRKPTALNAPSPQALPCEVTPSTKSSR